ncbi:MAG: glycosyltransferase family 4 protein [Saprospiraceae bacterium]|nr:glycosyltransferase family 4 protein [Pyrinomonadaceae bacterium]
MRIAFADTTLDGSIIGGAHTFLVQIMRGLSRKGHEIHLISKGDPLAKSAANIADSGARIHPNLWRHDALVNDSTPILARWLNDLRPDVYVVSVSPDLGWTVLPFLDSKIATFTIGHNDEHSFYDPVKHYASFLTRAIGVSDEICRRYVDECGMEKARVEWIPYGVEISGSEPVGSGDAALQLLYVGRVEEEQKRISDLIKIVKMLDQKGVDLRLSIVGDGVEMPKLKDALSSEIEDGTVELHGWVDSDKVIETMRRSEVFVLTSAYEGFCISLVEAMANGCCPVVTDIKSGNKQLITDGENGFISPVGDVESMAERIADLAADPERRLIMRKRAWETGKAYSVERMIEAYENCFERAIGEARDNPRQPDPSFPLMESCRSKYPLWLRRIKAKTKSLVGTG